MDEPNSRAATPNAMTLRLRSARMHGAATIPKMKSRSALVLPTISVVD
jgi:hypothetical protein